MDKISVVARRELASYTTCELVRPVVSVRSSSLWATTLSASSTFQKHAKPVPRERPVATSIVIRAYRRGPNARKL